MIIEYFKKLTFTRCKSKFYTFKKVIVLVPEVRGAKEKTPPGSIAMFVGV